MPKTNGLQGDDFNALANAWLLRCYVRPFQWEGE